MIVKCNGVLAGVMVLNTFELVPMVDDHIFVGPMTYLDRKN